MPGALDAAVLALPRPGEGGVPRELRPAAGISRFAVGDGLVLHEPGTQRAHLLDPVGAYLWVAWGEGLGVAEIAAELAESLPESAWRAETDVRNALAEWFELGLAVTGEAESEPEPEPAPRIRWNRERAYRCGDRVAVVLVPDEEVESWLDVSLAGFRDDEAAHVDLRVEVRNSRAGWDVVVADERYACRSVRQLGAVVRGIVMRRLGAGTFAGTLLTDADERALLVLGPDALRGDLAASWIRDGGACAGDDLFRLGPDGLVEGELVGIETPLGSTWWGELPGLANARPLLVTESGRFARMWRPPPDAQAGVIRSVGIVWVEEPSTKGALLAATPASPQDAFRDLLGSCHGEGRLGDESARRAAALATTVPACRLIVPDASVGRGVLSALPDSW